MRPWPRLFVLDFTRGIVPAGVMAWDSKLLRNGRPFGQWDLVTKVYTLGGWGFAVHLCRAGSGVELALRWRRRWWGPPEPYVAPRWRVAWGRFRFVPARRPPAATPAPATAGPTPSPN